MPVVGFADRQRGLLHGSAGLAVLGGQPASWWSPERDGAKNRENGPSVVPACMSAAPKSASKPTIGELEAGYPTCCKALRMLIKEKKGLDAIQRTVAWERLALLHRCLPTRYKAPDYLYTLLKREIEQPVAA